MAAEQMEKEPGDQSKSRHLVKRRGLIAGAAALVASAAVLRKSEPVAALAYNVGDGTKYIAVDPYSNDYVFWADASQLPGGYNVDGLVGFAKGGYTGVKGVGGENSGLGIVGFGGGPNGAGVKGNGTGTGIGVLGVGGGTGGIGAQGVGGAPNGIGVQGNGTGTAPGVYGVSSATSQSKGVQGQHTSNGYGVYGEAGDGGYGVTGVATTALGVLGQSTSGTGVHGASASGTGVQGLGGGDTSGNTTGVPIGVRGSIRGTGYGVYGNAGSGFGVYGNATTATGVGVGGVGATGVQGTSSANSSSKGVYGQHLTNGYGVYGGAGDGGFGVTGVATTAIGVFGQSTSGVGVYALIPSGNAPGAVAISGTNNSSAANSHGIVGTAGSGHGLIGNTNFTGGGPPYYGGLVGNAPNGAYAGLFFGKVSITGTLNGHTAIVQQSQIAVAHPDGTHRLANSVGAVESWLEDFGEGTVTNGQAIVKIDPVFATLVDTGKYHVFLTAHGNYNLHVAEMKADRFVIGVTDGGTNTSPTGGAPVGVSQVAKASSVAGTFSWRMAAKRKDGQGARLAAFTFPKVDAPTVPALPAELPKK